MWVACWINDRGHDCPCTDAQGRIAWSEAPDLVGLAHRGAVKTQARACPGEVDADGRAGNVGGPGDRWIHVVSRVGRSRIDCDHWQCCVDRQELGEGASVASAVRNGRDNGVLTVKQRTIWRQSPSDAYSGDRLVGLSHAPNFDSDRCGGHDACRARDRRGGSSREGGGAIVDRHGWCAGVQVARSKRDRTCSGQQSTVHEAANAHGNCSVG